MDYRYFDEVLPSQKQLPTLEQDNSKQVRLPVHVLRMLACGAPCIIFILVVAQGRWRETLCGSVPLRAANRSHNATYCDLLIGRMRPIHQIEATCGVDEGSLVLSPMVLCQLSIARASVAKARSRIYFSSVCAKLHCAADYAETSTHCGLFRTHRDKLGTPTPLQTRSTRNTRCVARATRILSRSVGRCVWGNMHTSHKSLYSTNRLLKFCSLYWTRRAS